MNSFLSALIISIFSQPTTDMEVAFISVTILLIYFISLILIVSLSVFVLIKTNILEN